MDTRSSRYAYEDFEPSWELAQEKDCDTLIVYLPGFRKEQLRVQLTAARALRISGERPVDNYRWSRFSKEFRVPSNIDTTKVAAKFENQMLYVKQPKLITQEVQQDKEKPAAREEKPAREAPRPAPPMAEPQPMKEEKPHKDQVKKFPTPSPEPQPQKADVQATASQKDGSVNGRNNKQANEKAKELENANGASHDSLRKQKLGDVNGKTDAPTDTEYVSQKTLEEMKASPDGLAEAAKAPSTAEEKQEYVSDTVDNAATMEEAEQDLSGGGIQLAREYYKQIVNGLLRELRNRRKQVNLIAVVVLALIFGQYVKNYMSSSKGSEN